MEQKFVKTHFVEMNLSDILEQLGEDETKSILSSFVCPLNEDVEFFIKYRAIEFSKRTTAKTHLVFWQTEETKEIEFVGYYTIASKVITVNKDEFKHEFTISAPLIGQLGKNFANGNNTLISGSDLLQLAINKVRTIQKEIGGRFVYLECEDNENLLSFYKNCGFKVFGSRKLDGEEIFNSIIRYVITYINIRM